MRSLPVLPYRVLPPDAVRPIEPGWTAFAGTTQLRVLRDGDSFAEWDAQLVFRLERSFRISPLIWKHLGLEPQSKLMLAVIGTTGNGLVRDVLFREGVCDTEVVQVVLTPSGDRLAKDLVLTTGVYVDRAFPSDELSPSSSGHRVWELSERIRLEGGAARLPIYEVSFRLAFPGERLDAARFHVEIAEDIELDIESALTVYLNSDFPEFVSQVNVRGSEAERQLWDGIIRRILVSSVFRDLDTAAFTSHERGTLAATVHRWTDQIWPNVPTDNLKELFTRDYARSEGQLESWLRALAAASHSGERA